MTLEKASRTVVKDCLDTQAGEEVVVIVDEKTRKIGEALFAACREVKAEPVLVEVTARKVNGEEPPRSVAAAMKKANVVIAPTSKSLSHTEARRQACEAGARVATLPGITEEVMVRTLATADYGQISDLSLKVAEVLTKGREARILSPGGADVRLSLGDRVAYADTGIIHTPGSFGNLPAGEAYLAPLEGTTEGKIVIDGVMAGIGELDEPIVVTVERGKIAEITGGRAARELKAMLEGTSDENAMNIAELGVGTNDKARPSRVLLEAEKILGTVHIAFGDNKSMGGAVKAPIHVDGVILKPTLIIDGEIIIKDGKILI